MRIKLSPQRADMKLKYNFNNEVISVKLFDSHETDANLIHEDTFDFTDMPNGEVVVEDIETTLPINPILSAKREDGVLKVELLNYIDADATEEERFPDWLEVQYG